MESIQWIETGEKELVFCTESNRPVQIVKYLNGQWWCWGCNKEATPPYLKEN